MKELEEYVKDYMKDCPLSEEQETKLLDALEEYLDDLESDRLFSQFRLKKEE